jgi:hypothetical protein
VDVVELSAAVLDESSGGDVVELVALLDVVAGAVDSLLLDAGSIVVSPDPGDEPEVTSPTRASSPAGQATHSSSAQENGSRASAGRVY